MHELSTFNQILLSLVNVLNTYLS